MPQSGHEGAEALLAQFHQAQADHDLSAILDCYADDGFMDKSQLRLFFQHMIDTGALRERKTDIGHAETYVFGHQVLIRPVLYRNADKVHAFSYHLARSEDGTWRIINSARSLAPGERVATNDWQHNAGRIVGAKGMLYTRWLPASPETVWETIATAEGLKRWWMGEEIELDLRPGGLFRHHWVNQVGEVEEGKSITFVEEPGQSGANMYMRFDIEPDGDGTLYHFYDAFHAVDTPLTMPWTSAGWHLGINALENLFTGEQTVGDIGLGGEFYFNYFRNFHRYHHMTDNLPKSGLDGDDWRAAFLVDPV